MAEFTEVMKQWDRMCTAYPGSACINCLLSIDNNSIEEGCDEFIKACPEEAEQIIMDWARENPQKTILQDFLEKYPNAKLANNVRPDGICPDVLFGCEIACKKKYISCAECWNRPLEEVCTSMKE